MISYLSSFFFSVTEVSPKTPTADKNAPSQEEAAVTSEIADTDQAVPLDKSVPVQEPISFTGTFGTYFYSVTGVCAQTTPADENAPLKKGSCHQ